MRTRSKSSGGRSKPTRPWSFEPSARPRAAVPAPRVAAHARHAQHCAPLQHIRRLAHVGVHDAEVAGAARANLVRDLRPRDLFHRRNHCADAGAGARAEVKDVKALGRIVEPAECGDVPGGQVHDVHKVVHGRAVGRAAVAAKNGEVRRAPGRDSAQRRQEALGRAAGGGLAQRAARMRARGVKVAQAQHGPRGVGCAHVAQDVLAHDLRAPVAVAGCDRARLVARRAVGPRRVDGRRGAENERLAVVFGHGAHEVERADDIGIVISERVALAVGDALAPGEVDDTREAEAVEEHCQEVQGVGPRQVALAKVREPTAGQAFRGVQGRARAGAQVVEDDNGVVCVGKERENVRADVARAARDEDRAGHVMLGLALLLYVLHGIVVLLWHVLQTGEVGG